LIRPAGETLKQAQRLLPNGGWKMKYQTNACPVVAQDPLDHKHGTPRELNEIAVPVFTVIVDDPKAVAGSRTEGTLDPVGVPTYTTCFPAGIMPSEAVSAGAVSAPSAL
jgi:hypothetical protein